MVQRIAFVTYETPYAPCGGVAAVMKYLPAAVQRSAHLPTVVISPCHHRIGSMARILPRADHVGTVRVPCEGREMDVHVLRYLDDWSWYFLQPDDPSFFAGEKHPYDVGSSGAEIGRVLLRDSLLFGSAVARALQLLAPGQSWAIMMQDWEAATTALAMAEDHARHRFYLTLHNSYDADVPDERLWDFGIAPATCPGTSVMQRAAGILEKPFLTVSRQFAYDLMEEPLQTDLTAPHLQSLFHSMGLRGIDNGPFASLAVPPQIAQLATIGRSEGLHKWKSVRRKQFCEALATIKQLREANQEMPWGGSQEPWGDVDRFLKHCDPHAPVPWFVLGGRDDSRQKGYDVAAIAAQRVLEEGLDARFLFFPIPGDEGLPGLRFLQHLAEDERFSDRVLVFPFRFRDGYMNGLQGSSFGLMPSLYEPFGAANEFYLNGTVGIGRATGGITEQIVPYRQTACFNEAVASRSNRWHGTEAAATGFLFREPDSLPNLTADWQQIVGGEYQLGDGSPNRIEVRSQIRLISEMAEALRNAIRDAARLYSEDRPTYYKMLAAGIQHIQQNFSWDRAGAEYVGGLEIPVEQV